MMEKSTEPNESKQEEGINEASEISTSQEEQDPTTEPHTVPEDKRPGAGTSSSGPESKD